jgi:hypothetical protein
LITATVSYNASTRTATLTPSAALANSTVYTAKIIGGVSGAKDAAGNALVSDYSWSFTTASSAPPVTFTIFPNDTPDPSLGNDGQAIEVGVKFRVTQAGFITGVRFYKKAGNTGTHTGHLWSSTGTMLAQATFSGETVSGWQQVLFTSPVAVSPGITYVAAYFSSAGFYNVTRPYFTSAVVNGPLRALADGEDGGNGVFRFSPVSAFPTSGNNASNFWVDVVFTASVATDNTPPTVLSVSPADGVTGVSINTTVSAVFSEAMNAATINGSTFELRNASNALVPTAVSYNPATNTATLTPSSPLANSTAYTAKITGGAPGIKDAANNAMVSDYIWSFTTASSSPPVTFTIFPNVTPDPNLGNDGQAIEVGVKFRVTQSGFITGVRFYKKAGNTGTHIGHLWSSTGTMLAQATFSGETASGWQQVLFTTPVAITTGTTYIASYFSSAGYYSSTRPYFTSAVVNGPLRALADGDDGGNGVYKYSTVSAFPNNTYQTSNYWVDVIFTTGSSSRIMTQQSSRPPSNEEITEKKLIVKITPNPAASFFKLVIMNEDKAPASVRISDISGRVLEHYEKVASGSLLQIGHVLTPGTYFAEIIQGDQRKVMKIIKVN